MITHHITIKLFVLLLISVSFISHSSMLIRNKLKLFIYKIVQLLQLPGAAKLGI